MLYVPKQRTNVVARYTGILLEMKVSSRLEIEIIPLLEQLDTKVAIISNNYLNTLNVVCPVFVPLISTSDE